MSWAKWSPLKLTIVSPPCPHPEVTVEGDHTPKVSQMKTCDRTLDGLFIGGTPVDSDLLWHAVATDRLGQESLGGLLVPGLREQKANGLAGFIDSAVEIRLCPLILMEVSSMRQLTH